MRRQGGDKMRMTHDESRSFRDSATVRVNFVNILLFVMSKYRGALVVEKNGDG